jgi:hypothetical protein
MLPISSFFSRETRNVFFFFSQDERSQTLKKAYFGFIFKKIKRVRGSNPATYRLKIISEFLGSALQSDKFFTNE